MVIFEKYCASAILMTAELSLKTVVQEDYFVGRKNRKAR